MEPLAKMKIQNLENTNFSHSDFVEALKKIGDYLPQPLRDVTDIGQYASKLKTNGEIFCAFENQKEIVGLVGLYANDLEEKKAFVSIIGILPEYQGKGLGRALMLKAITTAEQAGMTSVYLKVDKDNRRAQSLYKSLGFFLAQTSGRSWHMRRDIPVFESTMGSADCSTPLQKSGKLRALLGCDIDLRVKRDDLFPMAGGGNKARKIHYIVKDAIARGYNALVTNGGPQSNHARATAILAAQFGLPCHLVIVLQENKEYMNTGNILLMKMSGASIEYCRKDELAMRMDRAMEKYDSRGYKPLYIWGGSHCVKGAEPFVDAVQEFRQQSEGWKPDYMVFASATGTTHAGFAIGFEGSRTKLIGISVARDSKRGGAIVKESIEEYQKQNGLERKNIEIDFRDQWTCGGYEKYGPPLFETIKSAAKSGLFLDPTYSGKAFWALTEMVKSGEIQAGSKVLFWHTGGLMNLLACPEFADAPFSSKECLQ